MTKKTGTKNLTLRTLTIANLNREALQSVTGGLPANNYTKASRCAEQCCVSDYCGGSSGC